MIYLFAKVFVDLYGLKTSHCLKKELYVFRSWILSQRSRKICYISGCLAYDDIELMSYDRPNL